MLKAMTSSGISAQVSSAGWSGVVSIAPSASGDVEVASPSGCFSGFVEGGFGGGAEDMVGFEGSEGDARTTKGRGARNEPTRNSGGR